MMAVVSVVTMMAMMAMMSVMPVVTMMAENKVRTRTHGGDGAFFLVEFEILDLYGSGVGETAEAEARDES